MLRQSGVLMVIVLVTGCATVKVQSVSISEDPRFDAAKTNVAQVGWYSHTRDMAGIRVVVQLERDQVISRQSVWVRESDQTLTLCYSTVPSPDHATDRRKVVLCARVSGVPRGDRRLIVVSRACGKTS